MITSTSAEFGGVTSGHPAATDAGISALQDGGSVVDAALATAFTQWVVSPTVCGPGGDMFVLHVDAGTHRVYGGWSRVPLAIDPTEERVSSGPQACVVPGALGGAEAAWRNAGQLPWARLFATAIEQSRGHTVTEWMARSYSEVAPKGHGEGLTKVLDGIDDPANPPQAGDTVSCNRLGDSLELIAEHGIGVFYNGELTQQFVDDAKQDGAALSFEDFSRIEADVRNAEQYVLPSESGDAVVHVPPVPSQAQITPELLEQVSPSLEPTSYEFCTTVAPLTESLLTQRCVVGLKGTAVCSAARGDSLAIVVHSLAGVQLGSGWVPGNTGIAFGNRVGTALTNRDDLPGAHAVPGGIVPHTLSAAHIQIGDRQLLVATPGGDRQVQWLAQALQRFRLGRELDEILWGPRWFVSPVGDRFGVPGGIGKEWFLFGEPGIAWRDEREVAGYQVKAVDWVGGGLQGLLKDSNTLYCGSDPRGGGTSQTSQELQLTAHLSQKEV